MWDQIKQILAKNPSSTCIIVEKGKPAYVVSLFESCECECECGDKSEKEISFKKDMSELDLLEKINEEITNWKARQIEAEPEVEIPEEDGQLKIENLPVV